jgi:hypothetical protein
MTLKETLDGSSRRYPSRDGQFGGPGAAQGTPDLRRAHRIACPAAGNRGATAGHHHRHRRPVRCLARAERQGPSHPATTDFTYDGSRLRWASGTGPARTSGLITFLDERLGGAGVITWAADSFSVQLALQPVLYDCFLSVNAGAHGATGAGGGIELHTVGVDWDGATWVDAGLQFGYTSVAATGIGNPSQIVPVFKDTATGVTWTPDGAVTTMPAGRSCSSTPAATILPAMTARSCRPRRLPYPPSSRAGCWRSSVSTRARSRARNADFRAFPCATNLASLSRAGSAPPDWSGAETLV